MCTSDFEKPRGLSIGVRPHAPQGAHSLPLPAQLSPSWNANNREKEGGAVERLTLVRRSQDPVPSKCYLTMAPKPDRVVIYLRLTYEIKK